MEYLISRHVAKEIGKLELPIGTCKQKLQQKLNAHELVQQNAHESEQTLGDSEG